MSEGRFIMKGSVVSGVVGECPTLVIPEGVTAIADGAFSDCKWLCSVTIESTVFRTIGEKAFSGCISLKKITIKSLSGAIGDFAFYKCGRLRTVSIPSGAMEIGSNAFGQCPNLSFVSIPRSVMMIAADAMSTQDSPRLLVICDPETEASQFAQKHVIPHRGPERAAEILLALKTAEQRRKCLGVRTFSLFGQSIKVSNSLSLWENIISVVCGSSHTVGLKADGTVVAVGNTASGRCDVSAWADIVAISAGDDYTVGLRADGTVVVAGSWDYDLSQWQDVVAVSAGFTSVAGLKADGTVVSAGMNVRGECNTQSWTDIVAISVGDNAFGLKADGTVVFAGDPELEETRAKNWVDICTP